MGMGTGTGTGTGTGEVGGGVHTDVLGDDVPPDPPSS